MATLETRLKALELKRADPVRIWVTICGSGIYESNGETITEADFEARYGDGDDVRVIQVNYTSIENIPDSVLEAIAGDLLAGG